jgi:hypothetical protein
LKINWKNISIIELAAIVSEKLREKEIDSLVVGGACVSIYTRNRYQSSDIDFVSHSTLKQITSALSELGFSKRSSRHFARQDCSFFIEFVSPPAAVGRERIRDTHQLTTRFGNLIMLTPTDCVKDRLAAFFHWNDPQSLEQALMVVQSQDVNMEKVKTWALKEGYPDKYKVFSDLVKSTVKKGKKDKPQAD